MGTNNIVKWCKENGNPAPEFEYTGTSLVVTFRKAKIVGKEQKEKIMVDLNERQKKALEFLKTNDVISTKIYMKLNKVSDKTAFLELKDLFIKNILIKEERGRATIYKLKR